MGAKFIKYNLSGHGLLSIYQFPYTKKIYEFLSKENFDAKFHHTNQLGSLKNSLHGAHYTRYEYILLQWYLINRVQESNTGLGLGTNEESFGRMSESKKYPTRADILQTLSVLTNMGHLPDTFAASKIILDLLKNNKRKFRSGYRRGLKKEGKLILDKMIDDYDYYNIHLLNALFLLRRYEHRNNYEDIMEYSIKILLDYIERENSEFKKYWDIYTTIRKLSYLLLDSTYAPIPFKLELSSIISSFSTMFDGKSNEGEFLEDSMQKINLLLQESLYLSGNSIITSTQRSNEIGIKFIDFDKKVSFHKLSNIRKLLEPNNTKSSDINSIFNDYQTYNFPDIGWDKNHCVIIDYYDIDIFYDLFPKDLINFEENIAKKCRKRHSVVSVAKNNNNDTLRIALSFNNNSNDQQRIKSILKFTNYIINFNEELESKGYENKNNYINQRRLIKVILRAICCWDNNYELRSIKIKNSRKEPYFYGRGTTFVANKIKDYIKLAKDTLNKDELKELEVLVDYLNNINYQGYIMVFGGSAVVWESNNEIAEFDGIIIFPNKEKFLNIIESKNKKNGNTKAKNQLNKRMSEICQTFINYEIKEINYNGAVAKLSVNK